MRRRSKSDASDHFQNGQFELVNLMPDNPRSMALRFWFDSDAAIEQTFARLIHEPWGRKSRDWIPAIDVMEVDNAYLIALEIPGVSPEAVEIRANGANLTISGERQIVRFAQSGRAVQMERTQGRFSRTVRLQQPFDINQIEVREEQGVLYIRLPILGSNSTVTKNTPSSAAPLKNQNKP